MSGRKAGDTVGYIPRSIQKRFLDYSLRRGAAWRQIEALSREEIKLFSELDREFDLGAWVYSIDNITGEIVLERQKTTDEIALEKAQLELIAGDKEEEVTKNAI